MKTNYLLATLLLLAGSLSAQSLNRSDIFFQSGESYTRYYCDSIGPGPAGNGVTWDLSSLNSYASETQVVTDYSGSTYPTASIKVAIPSSEDYYQISDTLIQLIGRHSLGFPGNYSFTDAMDYLKFPITPLLNYSDNYSCNYVNNVGHSMSETGSIQREFSGFGILVTPIGTFTDVLRIKSVHILSTTDNNNGNIYPDTLTTYYWYKAGVHHELASVVYSNSFSGAYAISTYLDVPTDLGLEENPSFQLSLFPNPSATFISIQSDEVISKVEVYKLAGELALEQSANTTSLEMDLSALNTGMYLVKVYGTNGAVSVKRVSKN